MDRIQFNAGISKVLWAFDAFDESPASLAGAISALECLGVGEGLQIHPVYVISPEQLGLNSGFDGGWSDRYVLAARKQLEHKLLQVSVKGLCPPRILTHERPSLKGSVDTLVRYAENQGFDLIVAGSHGRTGLKRALLGSFAEEVLLQSEVPVLIMGKDAQINGPAGFDHLLFPTDFSQASETAFYAALRFAQVFHARVTLLHSIPRPTEAVVQSGVYLLSGGWVSAPVFIARQQAKQSELAESWVHAARRHHVDIEYVIDVDSHSVVESILVNADRRGISLIAMAAQSGRMKATLMGSICRQVARSAKEPILVLRGSVV